LAIYQCFIVDHKDETSEEDQNLILDKFDKFFSVCRKGIIFDFINILISAIENSAFNSNFRGNESISC
jgi:hypothetical protein